MRTLTFAALFTTVIILVAGVHLSALQSNAAPSTSPQAKSAQTTPAPATASTKGPTKKLE